MKNFKLYLRLAVCTLAAMMVLSCTETFDDTEIWNKLDNLENRVDKNEERIDAIERILENYSEDLEALQTVVAALQKNLYIEKVSSTNTGTVIIFSDGSLAVINHGKDGEDGRDGEDGKDGADGKDGVDGTDGKDGADGRDGKDAPVIGVGVYDGKYYWTQTIDGMTTWLLDNNGNKVPTSDMPFLDIDDEGYWVVSYDGGRTYARFLDSDGKPVKAAGDGGDTFFRSVVIVGNELHIELADGSEFVIPLGDQPIYKAVDMGLKVRWATFNVGAKSPSEIGTYFFWGDSSNTGLTGGKYQAPAMSDICGTEYDIATSNWGGTWRMPSLAELMELGYKCEWSSATVNGVQGCKVTGPNGNHIFLPVAGIMKVSTAMAGHFTMMMEDEGFYWAGESENDTSSGFAYCLNFKKDGLCTYSYTWNPALMKMVVRPVKD